MMNCALKTMNFVFKAMYFVFEMMNFAAVALKPDMVRFSIDFHSLMLSFPFIFTL